MTLYDKPLYAPSPDVVARHVRGVLFIVPLRPSAASLDGFYALNTTAADIWNGLAERRSPRRIAEDLSVKYDVSLDQAEGDVSRILHEMEAAGLVVRAGEGG